jgi:anti-sigma regulatory factor (Ser/Thr protein kinase)
MHIDSGATRDPVMLFMRMASPWVFIDEIRRFVKSFCACASPGLDREEYLALAVHELMQNAVACSGSQPVELSLEIDSAADRVSIQVTNACTPEQAAALQERVDRMRQEPDALKHYLAAMAGTSPSERGGLGLARIHFESQLGLEVVFEAGHVTVQAAGKLVLPNANESRVSNV